MITIKTANICTSWNYVEVSTKTLTFLRSPALTWCAIEAECNHIASKFSSGDVSGWSTPIQGCQSMQDLMASRRERTHMVYFVIEHAQSLL